MKACPLSCRCLAVAIETNVTNAGMYISLIVLMKFAQCESKFLRKTFWYIIPRQWLSQCFDVENIILIERIMLIRFNKNISNLI